MNKNSEINLKEHKIFFVGGKAQKVKDNNIIKGKMYVESFIPTKSNNKNIIFISFQLEKRKRNNTITKIS